MTFLNDQDLKILHFCNGVWMSKNKTVFCDYHKKNVGKYNLCKVHSSMTLFVQYISNFLRVEDPKKKIINYLSIVKKAYVKLYKRNSLARLIDETTLDMM